MIIHLARQIDESDHVFDKLEQLGDLHRVTIPLKLDFDNLRKSGQWSELLEDYYVAKAALRSSAEMRGIRLCINESL